MTKPTAQPALTPRQQRFVDEYLVDLNATQAAIRAGYSAKTAAEIGCENLSKPQIAAALKAAKDARAAQTGVTAQRVVAELAKIGFADIRNIVRWGGAVPLVDPESDEVRVVNGVALVDSMDLTADQAAAIAEVSQSKGGTLRIKLHDKQAALVSLGRHLGIFTDKQEVTGKDGAPLVPVLNIFPAGSKPRSP